MGFSCFTLSWRRKLQKSSGCRKIGRFAKKGCGAMYNPQLETFIRAADAGSFNKAAEESHITPTAMIKQINSLEADLDVELFTRTHRGLVLTRAVESLYKDAKYMIEYSRKKNKSRQQQSKSISV